VGLRAGLDTEARGKILSPESIELIITMKKVFGTLRRTLVVKLTDVSEMLTTIRAMNVR
jgi:hypothetical protein